MSDTDAALDEQPARFYVGALTSAHEDDGYVSAEIRGDSARIYTVSYEAGDSGWRCNCPTIGTCSHVRAIQLITVVEPRRTA